MKSSDGGSIPPISTIDTHACLCYSSPQVSSGKFPFDKEYEMPVVVYIKLRTFVFFGVGFSTLAFLVTLLGTFDLTRALSNTFTAIVFVWATLATLMWANRVEPTE